MTDAREVRVPYDPRPLQWKLHSDRGRFNVVVCHRRFGKTVWAINELIKGAVTCEHRAPRLAYIAPQYRQAKQVAWDYLKHYAQPLLSELPRESELRVDLLNGGRIQLFGADNPDALRGMYLDGVVLDEYAQMPPRLWSEVIRPALSDRKGWATFLGTPQGRNEFFRLYEYANDPDNAWHPFLFKASETGIIDPDELQDARATMGEEEFAQEYECSFQAAIRGAYYGALMEKAEEAGRIGRVPFDPALRVHTSWDIGIGDQTVIWFFQRSPGGEWHWIDCYANSGEALSHYVSVLEEKKASEGYIYGTHNGPHDFEARELGTGKTRIEMMDRLGVRINVIPLHRVQDRIERTRQVVPLSWFDAAKCADGIEALRQYRREWDEKNKTWKRTPLHDWTSHYADAFGEGCMAPNMSLPSDWSKPMAPKRGTIA